MVYEPREDSFLLQEQVKKLSKGSVLDIGTGSGIQAEAAAKKKSVTRVVAADVDKGAINFCRATIRRKKIKFIVGDLFSNIRNKQKFDTIVFNPPYLPEEPTLKDLVGARNGLITRQPDSEQRRAGLIGVEKGELALTGGKYGYEVLEKFLREAGNFLKPNGIILIVFSSLTDKNRVDSLIEQNLFDAKQLSAEHIFFEDLFVYSLKKNKLLTELEKKGLSRIRYFARGKRGVVYVGEYKGRKVAVKTKKKESLAIGRMKNEARMLKLLNKYKIGPKFLFAGANYVVYEFVEGKYLAGWVETAKKNQISSVLKSALEQAFKLDRLGIAKEEMHRPLKHIIVGNAGKKGNGKAPKATLIDFERAHKMEKAHNVTQLCQYVLSARKILAKKGIRLNKNKIISLARAYSEQGSKQNLAKILALFK